jgi:hypothetical protein
MARERQKTVAEILAIKDDSELASALHGRIVLHHGETLDASKLSQEERAVLLVEAAVGIIGNGGFNYLFEGDFPGDPYYHLTAEAFEAIGASKAAAAFRKALGLFPDSKPPTDRHKRLWLYRRGTGEKRHEIDCQFWDASKEIDKALAAYIRAHGDSFRHLDQPRTGRKKASSKPLEYEREQRVDLSALPHWARVAFAAQCVRRVMPVFRRCWPNASADRREALWQAIELAEQSADEGRVAKGLDEAILNATMVAGCALMAMHGSTHPDEEDSEPLPNDGNAAVTASFVAKAAENAAKAAGSKRAQSWYPAAEAFDFACKAAGPSSDIVDELAYQFSRLRYKAEQEGWSGKSPVPLEVWEEF